MELDREFIVALPERLETSDTNASAIWLSQSNLGVQIAAFSAQSLFQGNAAAVYVTQVN